MRRMPRGGSRMMSLPDFRYKQVIVHVAGGSGERLRFLADNIVLEDKEGKCILRHSCHRLFALFIVGEVTITSVLIKQARRFDFPIILMSGNFRVITKLNSGAEGNTILRKKQYEISERTMQIAKKLIAQKISNQMALIKSLRYRAAEDLECIEFLKSRSVSKAKDVHELMGVEGTASKAFFSCYFRNIGWTRREPRCKHDIPNLLLDIGYTYLFNFIEAMLCLYGFDVYCGVHHTLFYHRKSLVCDIIEPFRCIIDKRIRKLYSLRQINEKYFQFCNGSWMLPWKNQKKYISLFLKDILFHKEDIFLFCREYYRWFLRNKPIENFPVFNIAEVH